MSQNLVFIDPPLPFMLSAGLLYQERFHQLHSNFA